MFSESARCEAAGAFAFISVHSRLNISFMSRIIFTIALGAILAGSTPKASAAERVFLFEKTSLGQLPEGFHNAVAGSGKPGEWTIVETEVPSAIAPLTGNAPVPRRKVLAQTSNDKTDEHFPILFYEPEVYGDFTFSTRFKINGGEKDQMAGIVFRYQDEKNFYVLRASALDENVRFYEVREGSRGELVGPKVEIKKNVWYELSAICSGNQIRCLLNGTEIIPALNNNSFPSGKIGFWTKSDSTAFFVDAKISYTPREPLVKVVVRETMTKYPRIDGLKVFAKIPGKSDAGPEAIATKSEKDLGEKGGDVEKDVIERGKMYFGRGKGVVTVTLPLHDKNGDSVAAVRITLTSFAGQTEQNAIARGLPIIKYMEQRMGLARDLFE